MKWLIRAALILFLCVWLGGIIVAVAYGTFKAQKDKAEWEAYQESLTGWKPPAIEECGLPRWDEIRKMCNERT